MLPLLAKNLNFKMAAIFEKFAKSGYSLLLRYHGGRKFRGNSLTVKEIEAILCFANFGKNVKIQNGRHF